MDKAQALEMVTEFEGSPEEHRVRSWRLDEFRRLGFDLGWSAVMADSPVDLAAARRLVGLGCPLGTASQILL